MDFRNRSERKCFILVFSKLWSFALFDPSSYFQHNFVCCCDLIWENSVDKCPWGGRNSPTTQNVLARGGGQVVSMPAFYSDYPSSNLADAHSFFL